MATTILFLELAVVLAMIFIGARMGGIGLGIFRYARRLCAGLWLRTEARQRTY